MATLTMAANVHKRKRPTVSHNKTNENIVPPRKKMRKNENGNCTKRKPIKRQLTLKLNSYFLDNIETRPKNEYVHIETLYNYSKPVWEFHRPSLTHLSYNGKIQENKNRNGFYLDDIDIGDDESISDDDDDDDDDEDEDDNESIEIEKKVRVRVRVREREREKEEEKPSIFRASFINNIEFSSLSYSDRERLSRMKLSLLYIKCCIAVLRPNSPTFPKQNELHRWLDSKNHPPLTRIDIRQARKALKDDYNILLHSNSNKLTDKYTSLYQAQDAMKKIYESAKSKCYLDKNKQKNKNKHVKDRDDIGSLSSDCSISKSPLSPINNTGNNNNKNRHRNRNNHNHNHNPLPLPLLLQ